ncbi:hypothetical protein LOC51_23855 [Rubrivivax sp. JA1024]|nr:hypothetical protein [Rubrivivax sp. JA1024]
MPDFNPLIQKYLSRIDASKPGERAIAYEQARSALDKAFKDDPGNPNHLGYLYDLDETIAATEARYRTHRTKLDDLLDPVRQLSTRAKLKYGAIAGAISLVSDFIKPILELTLPILIGSAVAGLVLFAGSRLFGGSRALLQSGAFLCSVLFVCSFGLWGAQHFIKGADAQGVVAELVPGASQVQNALLAMLSRIESNTRETAEGVEKLNKGVSTLKRETSADPRKELQNLGRSFNEQDFLQTMAMCDIRALRLYKQAEMPMPRYKALEVLVLPENVACLEIYRADFVAIGPDICFSSDYYYSFRSKTRPVDWLHNGFKIPERKKFIEGICGETRLRDAYPELYGGKSRTASSLETEIRRAGPLVLDKKEVEAARERLNQRFGETSSAPKLAAVALSSEEIRRQIIGKKVNHANTTDIVYRPDGSFEGRNDRGQQAGTYQLMADGRLCMTTTTGASACYQYYREERLLKVRRNDRDSDRVIGLVSVRN